MKHTPETDYDLRRAFERGNYDSSYVTQDYDKALSRNENEAESMIIWQSEFNAAFTLGFFASYTLEEMGGHVETYLEAYFSETGQRVIALGYCDPLEQDEIDSYQESL